MTDFSLYLDGSIAVLTPQTPAARVWIAAKLAAEDWQWFGSGIAIEPRYLPAILDGIMADSLTIEGT